MALPATDNANRAAGGLGASWTYGPTGSDATTLQISSSTTFLLNTSGVDAAAYWNADTFGDDQYSKFTVVSGLTSGLLYQSALARCSGTGASFRGYQIGTDGGSGAGHTDLFRWDSGGVLTNLGNFAATFATGDVLEIRVSGSATVNVSLYKNGSLVGTITDSSVNRIASGGAAGIGGYCQLATSEFDDWEGGNLAGGTPGNASGDVGIATASTPTAVASTARSVNITMRNGGGTLLNTVARRFWTRATLDQAAADGGVGGLSVVCNSLGVFALSGLGVSSGPGWLTYKDPSDDLNCHSVPVTFV